VRLYIRHWFSHQFNRPFYGITSIGFFRKSFVVQAEPVVAVKVADEGETRVDNVERGGHIFLFLAVLYFFCSELVPQLFDFRAFEVSHIIGQERLGVNIFAEILYD
jgi:hypothetical protein